MPKVSRNASVKNIYIFAAILMITGVVITSPVGSLFFICLAGLLAAGGIFFSSKQARLTGWMLLIMISILIFLKYPYAHEDFNLYLQRSQKNATGVHK